MPTSLFIEQHDDSIAFYINGDLQFDTADEAIYHEYLVIPAISLAIQRFPKTALHVLICGGGDGLAVRDVLRFEQVKKIDLVDYNPEVLELGKTVFKPYNLGSLERENVTVYTQEAFQFVSQLPDNHYHVVICDFTYPNSSEETEIYSREWFQSINRVLMPSGIICTNGVSPEKKTAAFWSLYQTILAADLTAKPLQLDIPSFRWHGYGNWGFFLASSQVITREEIETIIIFSNLHYLNHSQLLQAFVFDQAIANFRHSVTIHTIESPQLLYYLLNYPANLENLALKSGDYINFLDLAETTTAEIGNSDFLDLESVAKFWLENIYESPDSQVNSPDINRLLPSRHHYHSPQMTSAWLAHLKELLAEIDGKRLLNSLLARAQELPPQIASELKNLADKINSNQPLPKLPPKIAEFITLLSVTLLMANLVSPDSVFAKGSYSSSSGYVDDDSSSDGKFLGFMMVVIGGFWLASLLAKPKDE
ncbi:putative spermidine synthase with an N-terminal membrane domain [Cylindrospermum stagnale PCC 7417]|uniref:Polyamine aminopropyltransferase n=1 Tax=Cylindrospermum stagnale PCC 7417 TaxID=56107 RepID=K9WSB0_9NOST|nr:spermidine synthase [Cylindrospermum stagnale]AFZ23275.1 putative spermidine synthase with an N-terminal membrane domain [Cylindrospermum stagnale PCC 7417]